MQSIQKYAPLFLVALALFTSPANAQEDQTPKLTLTGVGTLKAAPDMALINSGVITQRPTAKAALAANTKKMTAVFDTLKKSGFEKKDLQTSNFNVGPRYKYSKDGTPPRIIGYQVTNQLTIRVRELAKLGELLDLMAQVGANRMGQIRFTHSNIEELQDKARELAITDALRKAKIYTSGTGSEIVKILSISENSYHPRPRPLAMERSAKVARSDVPIASGENSISTRVHIVWEIK